MGGFIEPSPLTEQPRESNLRPKVIAVVLMAVVLAIIVLLSRGASKAPTAPHPYASNLKLSELKMSAAENFVGASVTYIDGTVTNAGDKTVTHTVVHVLFRDSLNQVAQAEDVPLLVLKTSGPYPDVVDLNMSPLAPAQNKPLR